jgi:hypothetical protein
MTRIGVLSVARLYAIVNAAVESAIASVGTCKHSSPLFNNIVAILCNVLLVTCNLITAVGAKQSLLNLATVTASVYTDLTSSAKTLMTRSGTLVFSARHKIATDFSTTPAIFIVCFGATACRLVLTAEA